MRRSARSGLVAVIATCLVIVVQPVRVAAVVHSGTTEMVSVDSSETQSTAVSQGPEAISANGRMVAFVGNGHLESPDTNFLSAYVRDLDAGTTQRVSLTSNGGLPASGVWPGALCISRDGRFVGFASNSIDIDPRDTTNDLDLFLRDRTAGTTELVSVGTEPNSISGNSACAISDDGLDVAFDSFGPLIAEDANGTYDVYVRDRRTGTTQLVSRDTSGSPGSDASGQFGLDMSSDGRYVVFDSVAALDPADTNGARDVYLRDRSTETTSRLSVLPGGVEGNGNSGVEGVSISADGRWVAFASDAPNFMPANNNRLRDIYRLDRNDGTITLASVDESPASSDYYGQPSISDDGVFVAFRGNHLTSDDTNSSSDVYRRNMTVGETELISVRTDGVEGNDQSEAPAISSDGVAVTFRSYASNLVNNDVNLGNLDVFIRTSTDVTPPSVTIDSVAPNPTQVGTTVTWHADEAGAYAVRSGGTDCSSGTVVASGTYSSAPSQVGSNVAASSLAEGPNTIRVCVTDGSNNTGQATAIVTKDTTPPVVTIDSVAPNPTSDGTSVTWHANEEGTFEVRVGGTSCSDGTVVASGSYGISPDPFISTVSGSNLGEGSNTLRVCVTDAAGNTGPASGSVTKDITPPISSITFPLNASYNATGWTDLIMGTASDPGGVGVNKVYVSIQRRSDSTWWNGTSFLAGSEQFVEAFGTNNWSLAFPDSRLTDGTNYLIHVQAKDSVQNRQSLGPSLFFNYDVTPPSVGEPKPRFAEGTPVLQSGNTYSVPLLLDWTSSDQTCNANVTRGLKSFTVYLQTPIKNGWADVQPPVATIPVDQCDSGPFALPSPDRVLLSQLYRYRVVATDWAGNTTPVGSMTSSANGFKVTYTDDAKPTAIAFTGKWTSAKVGVSLFGTVSSTTTAGSTASWSGPFQEIAYVSPTNTPSRGTAIITITDWGGLARTSVERNLTGPATPMQIIYAASVGLQPPTPKNPINPGIRIQSKDSLVVSLDAFLVLRY